MSGKTKGFKTRQRKVAPKKNACTKPKAFTKETGRHLQDFPDHSISEFHEKGPADQSFFASGQLGKLEFSDLPLCVAFLNYYAKVTGSQILHALSSKLTDEFKTKIQQVENLENCLQQSEKEKREFADNLIKVSSALRLNEQETERLKIELEKFSLRIVDKETLEKLKYENERKTYEKDTLWKEFHQEKEKSQTQTQIHGPRDMRLKFQGNVKSNQKVYENTLLEYKLKQALDELERTEAIVKEAKQGQEFEHALKNSLDQTVQEDRTIIELLKEKCIELSLSNEYYLAELLETKAAIEQTRDEKDYILRQIQAAEKAAKDNFDIKKSSDEETQRICISRK